MASLEKQGGRSVDCGFDGEGLNALDLKGKKGFDWVLDGTDGEDVFLADQIIQHEANKRE